MFTLTRLGLSVSSSSNCRLSQKPKAFLKKKLVVLEFMAGIPRPASGLANKRHSTSQALTHKCTSSQISNVSRTPETVTPTLTSGTSSASSINAEIPNPLPNAHPDNDANGIWQMSSLDSGNGTMALSLSGSDFNMQSLKSPPGLEDFFADTDFDAFGLEQDDDRFFESMDLDVGNKNRPEISRAGRCPTLDGGDSRSIASPLAGRHDSQVHRLPSGPPQSPWSNVHPSLSTSVPSRASAKEAENDLNSRPMQCDCLGVTLSLLEKVYFRDTRVSVSNLIGLLHEFKQWMRSFRDVTECTACNCATDSLMLLVVVCEKLGDSFQIISTIYEKLAETSSENSSSSTPEMCMLGGKYSVDTVEEFACLFKFLTFRHLQFLYHTTVSLDNKAVQQELTTHHESLQRQFDRLRLLRGTIGQAHLKETGAGRKMIPMS